MRCLIRRALVSSLVLLNCAVAGSAGAAQKGPSLPASNPAAVYAAIDAAADRILPKVVAWRRDFHEHPELGNSEVRTGKIVADELRSLGFEVKTGVAKTGVVGLLRGALPGPVVALPSAASTRFSRSTCCNPAYRKPYSTVQTRRPPARPLQACRHLRMATTIPCEGKALQRWTSLVWNRTVWNLSLRTVPTQRGHSGRSLMFCAAR